MNIKKKHIKWILMLAMILFILFAGKDAKVYGKDLSITHKAGDNPIDCPEQGKDGINFFCRSEDTPWNWYPQSENIIINPQTFYYKEEEETTVDPTISFGIETAKLMGTLNLNTIQELIWGSVKYTNSTCLTGRPALYTNGSGALKRADQFGMFYYGVLGGKDGNKLDCWIEEGEEGKKGDKAKVYINQTNRNIILGPYRINLTINNATGFNYQTGAIDEKLKLSETTIMTNLWKELIGENTKELGNVPRFAEGEIVVDGASETKFLNENGTIVKFPDFNENFYIQCKVGSNTNTLNPKINIKYTNSASCTAYNYISVEDRTRIPGYAIMDVWYDTFSISDAKGGSGDGYDLMLAFIGENLHIRRCRCRVS